MLAGGHFFKSEIERQSPQPPRVNVSLSRDDALLTRGSACKKTLRGIGHMKGSTRINPPCISRQIKIKQLFRHQGIVITFLHSLKNRSFEPNVVSHDGEITHVQFVLSSLRPFGT